MAEQTNPLAAIQFMEATVFRTGQLARRLLADHPTLNLRVANAYSWSYEDFESTCELNLHAGDADGARALAAALGIELHSRIADGFPGPREYVRGETEVNGVTVKIFGFRKLSGDEVTAWRAQQDLAAAAEGGGGRD